MKTIITDFGLKKFITAGTGGPKLNITSVKIGSTILNPTSTMTDVDNMVWAGDSTYITYQILDDNTFAFVVTLDEGIGNFQVGNIGLFMEDGTMFCLTTLLYPEQKIANGSRIIGNRLEYVIPILLSGISDAVDVSYLMSAEASLPVVRNENVLPDYRATNFSAYIVMNVSQTGLPGLAMRTQTGWSYLTAADIPGPGPGPTPTPTGNTLTYKKTFTTEDFVYNSGTDTYTMYIPKYEHLLGSDVGLVYLQKQTADGFENVYNAFFVDNQGNVSIIVNESCNGRLVLIGQAEEE